MRISFGKKVTMALAAVLTLATSVARAQTDGNGCSDVTLTGSYAFPGFRPDLRTQRLRHPARRRRDDLLRRSGHAHSGRLRHVERRAPFRPDRSRHGLPHKRNGDVSREFRLYRQCRNRSPGASRLDRRGDQAHVRSQRPGPQDPHRSFPSSPRAGSTQPVAVSIHSDGEKVISPRLHAPTALSNEAAPSRNLVWTPPDNLTPGDAVTYNLSLTGGTGTCASGCLFHPGAPSWYSIGPSVGSGSFSWTLQAVSASRPYAAPVAGPSFTLP